MNSAKQNIALLPDWCYGILLTDKSVIVMKAGESGYWPAHTDRPPLDPNESLEDFVNEANAQRGVTIAERKAMEHGSAFGFGGQLANPKSYNERGDIIRNELKQD